MLSATLTTALLLTPAPLLVQDAAPPGMVLVPGGKTKVGTSVKDAEELIKGAEDFRNPIAGETPQITVDVEDFYLATTQVTNEQYAQYVSATGAKPPYYWGDAETLSEAQRTFLEEQGKRIQEARERGERPERELFDAEVWWEDNWKGAKWGVPEDLLTHPVTFVNYYDALGYCRWAGVRLMTEFEYTRAARRDSDVSYPWGDDWKDGIAVTFHLGDDKTYPVGSFDEGAVGGIYDLVGNVWEWTSSPYNKFKGYKLIKVKIGKGSQARPVEAMAGFDPTYRVAVGGSFKQPKVGTRIPTRFGAERTQSTDALGFRVASGTTSGADLAQTFVGDEVRLNQLPMQLSYRDDVDFNSVGTQIKQRWFSEAGTSGVPGYGVITGYEYMLFTPVAKIPCASDRDLTKDTEKDGPALVGFVSVSRPLMEPELDAGTYLVAWRGIGKLAEDDGPSANMKLETGQDGISFSDVPGFDADKECLIFYNTFGEPQVAVEARPLTVDRMKGYGAISLEEFVPPTPEELKALEKAGTPPPTPMDTLVFSSAIPAKSKGKAFMFDLPLKIKPGTIDDNWN